MIDNLGDFVISELESSASARRRTVRLRQGSRAVAGRKGAASPSRRSSDGELSEPLIAIETTDAEATQEFVDKQAEDERASRPRTPPTKASTSRSAAGGQRDRRGRRLARHRRRAKRSSKPRSTPRRATRSPAKTRFQDAIAAASDGSLADIYVDVGGVIEQSERRDRPAGAGSPRERRHRPERSDRGGQRRSRRPTRSRSTSAATSAARSARAATSPSCSARCRPLLRRLRRLRLRRAARRSDRQPRRDRHPAGAAAGRAEEHR